MCKHTHTPLSSPIPFFHIPSAAVLSQTMYIQQSQSFKLTRLTIAPANPQSLPSQRELRFVDIPKHNRSRLCSFFWSHVFSSSLNTSKLTLQLTIVEHLRW